MLTYTFTTAEPLLTVPLNPPEGATAVLVRFTIVAQGSDPAGGVRLAHIRLAHPAGHPNQDPDNALPRESEICELIFRNGAPTAGFSGFGGKRAVHPVRHLGEVPNSFPVVINLPLNGKDIAVSAGGHTAMSDTDIAPGNRPMDLLLGMAPVDGQPFNALSAPIGWTFGWDDNAIEWLPAVTS